VASLLTMASLGEPPIGKEKPGIGAHLGEKPGREARAIEAYLG